MPKKRLCLLIALLLVCSTVLTGCKSEEESGIILASSEETASNSAQTNVLDGWRTPPPNITYDPVMVTEATPDSLENIAWIFKDGTNADTGSVLFFRNGIMTVVSTDACYGTPYEYQGTQLEASYGEMRIAGEAIEGLLYMYFYDGREESGYIAVWSSIEEAMQFAKSLNSGFQAPFSPDDLGITVNMPVSGDVTEPTELSGETPESLDRTAWIRKGETDPERCLAFFFKDGVVTIVSKDFYFDASYRYKSYIMTTDPEEVGYDGDVSGNKMQVTSFQSPYCEMTMVDPDGAISYAKAINPDFVSPFDGEASTPDDKTPYTVNADGTYTWQVGKYELTTRINVMDYIRDNVWYSTEMAVALGWEPLDINGNVNRDAKYVSMFSRGNLFMRLWESSGDLMTSVSGYIKGEAELFTVWNPQNLGDFKYTRNEGKDLCTLELIVCFAYAAEQLADGTPFNPFENIFTSENIYD